MYEVDYVYSGGQQLQATASASPRNLTELDENELYRIRVRAYTSAGRGPYSDEIRVMTPEDGECRTDGKARFNYSSHTYM